MKIYLAHPISGLTPEAVLYYYTTLSHVCSDMGYEVLCPMTGKGQLRVDKQYHSQGYDSPVATNHAIFERDKWMVTQCDILLCDLSDRKGFSVGCTMEVAWGSLLGKHTIVIMPEDSEYRHAFMLEAADIVFTTLNDATKYLQQLIEGSLK